MWTSKLIGEFDFSGWMVFVFFLVSDCDLDLKSLGSLGLEGGRCAEVYCGNCLSLEYERDLYRERESRLYGDL